MARIPDRFDLWVRHARDCPDPDRQVDYVLGALVGLNEWHFLNLGTREAPQSAKAQMGNDLCHLVFTDPGRVEELIQDEKNLAHRPENEPLPLITIPTAAAMTWCVENKAGLLVNPGEYAAMIPFERLEAFHTEWTQRGGRQAAGFWIPNLTTEEEDFWQEHGL